MVSFTYAFNVYLLYTNIKTIKVRKKGGFLPLFVFLLRIIIPWKEWEQVENNGGRWEVHGASVLWPATQQWTQKIESWYHPPPPSPSGVARKCSWRKQQLSGVQCFLHDRPTGPIKWMSLPVCLFLICRKNTSPFTSPVLVSLNSPFSSHTWDR